jgi:DNA invertase Pin-like site-specific DNA recombinase
MIYGYARVSTEAQDLTGSTAQLKAAGCQKIFREKITGTTADRPQLKKLMAALAQGDVVIIPAVDRLSRDTTDLLVIAPDMQKAGAGIRSLAEPFLDTTSDFAEIIFAILGVAAKLEYRRIKERTARGRADAKAENVERNVSDAAVGDFIRERLATCFDMKVAKTLILRNSKSSPLYYLCFAASNERGAGPALKIANSILDD